MASFNLSTKYRPMAGTNFFARQVTNAAHQVMNVARSVAAKKTSSTALPTDIPSADAPKSKMPLIIGGVAGVGLLVLLLSGKKKSAVGA